jgi:hypothetical protein
VHRRNGTKFSAYLRNQIDVRDVTVPEDGSKFSSKFVAVAQIVDNDRKPACAL